MAPVALGIAALAGRNSSRAAAVAMAGSCLIQTLCAMLSPSLPLPLLPGVAWQPFLQPVVAGPCVALAVHLMLLAVGQTVVRRTPPELSRMLGGLFALGLGASYFWVSTRLVAGGYSLLSVSASPVESTILALLYAVPAAAAALRAGRAPLPRVSS